MADPTLMGGRDTTSNRERHRRKRDRQHFQGLGPNDPARRTHPGGGLCTPAVIRMLKAMEVDRDNEDGEAVYERGQVWVGCITYSPRTLLKAVKLCAVRDVTEGTGSLQRYVINEVGRAIIADPSQANAVSRHLATRTNMTVKDGKVVPLD